MEENEKEYKYATPNSPEFSVQLGNTQVTAVDKVLTLNEEQHQEMQKLIKSGRVDIKQNVILMDMDAAERVAAAHRATVKPVAASGAVSSEVGKMGQQQAATGNNAVKPVDVSAPAGTEGTSLLNRLRGNSEQVQAQAAIDKVAEMEALRETAPGVQKVVPEVDRALLAQKDVESKAAGAQDGDAKVDGKTV